MSHVCCLSMLASVDYSLVHNLLAYSFLFSSDMLKCNLLLLAVSLELPRFLCGVAKNGKRSWYDSFLSKVDFGGSAFSLCGLGVRPCCLRSPLQKSAIESFP